MSQPLPFPSVLLLTNPRKSGSTENILAPRSPVATLTRFSTRICEETSKQDLSGRHLRGLNRFAQEIVAGHFVQYRRHGSDDRDAEYGRLSSAQGDSCRCRTCAEWCGRKVAGGDFWG